MPDVVVNVEKDESGFEILCAKVSSDQGELNVRATRSEFLELRRIRDADWTLRSSLAVGASAGSRVFWTSDGELATALVGADDETWDIAVYMPLSIVDDIVSQASNP